MHVGNNSACAVDSYIATPNVQGTNYCRCDCAAHCDDDDTVSPHVVKPGVFPPCVDCPVVGGQGGIAARSRHWSGVDAALADGAVRFVSNDIDKFTWRALLTIMAGDVVGQY
jgi:hypothetical protein